VVRDLRRRHLRHLLAQVGQRDQEPPGRQRLRRRRLVPGRAEGRGPGLRVGDIPGGTLIRCTWVDDTTAGDVLYANGAATGLADAAAKTNQARAAVDG